MSASGLPFDDFRELLRNLPGPDAPALVAARERDSQLTKPPGALGRLEEIAFWLAAWTGRAPAVTRPLVAIFAGNHGVTRHNITPIPPAVTQQMVENFAAGGAAINALSEAAGLELTVVALDLDRPTADFTGDAAMSEAECLDALNRGAAVVDADLDLIILGEMGIGNSTAAAALCARSFAGNVAGWVGPGTGVDGHGVARKADVIERALAFHMDAPRSAFETLRRVGGREIAAIAGAILRARQLGIPVLLDGFICTSAIAPLAADNPAITDHCLAGHCSAEPGHKRLLGRLDLDPLLTLDMRLGEGSGAAVAVQILHSAVAAHNGMASFAEAGIVVE